MMEDFFAYRRERLQLWLFGPVVLLLTGASCWAANSIQPGAALRAAALMALLVVQFRLWDDLADRAHDRAIHPGRVLVRANAQPFILVTFALALAAFASTYALGGLPPLLTLVGLNAAFAVLYSIIRPHLSNKVWRFPVLLAKYPAFVVGVAITFGAASAARTLVASLLTYGVAHGYEALHTSRVAARLHPHALESTGSSK